MLIEMYPLFREVCFKLPLSFHQNEEVFLFKKTLFLYKTEEVSTGRVAI